MAYTEQPLQHDALLIISHPSSEFSSLKATSSPAISKVLSDLSREVRGTDNTAVLDIAIVVPQLRVGLTVSHVKAFDYAQKLIAVIYKLLGLISVSEGVELDGPGGVDARVFFIDHNTTITGTDMTQDQNSDLAGQGPIVALQELSKSGRTWSSIYVLNSSQANDLLEAFFRAFNEQGKPIKSSQVQKLQSVESSTDYQNPASGWLKEDPHQTSSLHYSVAVGGTFDHLHIGHKLLITATALALDKSSLAMQSKERTVIIGITGDELLVKKRYAEVLESWEERWKSTWRFLESILNFQPEGVRMERVSKLEPNGEYVHIRTQFGLQVKFVKISDPFGPTITDESISALVVSKETHSGGEAVNAERVKKGWAKLDIFEVDVLELRTDDPDVPAENFDSKISSTEIRRRRMDLSKGSL